MAAAIPAMMIASTAVSVIGAIQQGAAAKQAGDYNAAIGRRNAQIAIDQSAADEARQRRVTDQQIGQIRANYGASGVDMGEGSPLEVLGISAMNGELDAQTIRYHGRLKSIGALD